MFAVIGLGNPGSKYASTRHNLGFRAVMALADSLGLSDKWKEKSGCAYVQATIVDEDCLLLMPQKFMNLSGEAVRPLISFYKIPVPSIVVLYDELDLPPGVIRLGKSGSAGGHRGVQDLIAQLSSADFFRVRMGIGHPRNTNPPLEMDVSDYVLSVPKGEERALLEQSVIKAAQATQSLIAEGLEVAQRKFN